MDTCLPRIFFQMRHLSTNLDIIDQLPHLEYMGMLVTYRYLKSESFNPSASHPLYHDTCEAMDIPESALPSLAYESFKTFLSPRLYTLPDMARQLAGGPSARDIYGSSPTLSRDCVYVCTNRFSCFGANLLFNRDFLSDIGKKMEENYFVVPSSIHELLLVPCSKSSPKYLTDTLKSMNRNSITTPNILSDKIFCFDRNADALTILS